MHTMIFTLVLGASLSGPSAEQLASKTSRLPAEPTPVAEQPADTTPADASPSPAPVEDPTAEPTTVEATTAAAPLEGPPSEDTPPTPVVDAEQAEPAPSVAETPAETTPAPPAPAAPPSAGVTASSPSRPDRPIQWRLDFTLGVGSTIVGDTGFLAFDEDQSLFGFDVGARWDYKIGQRFFLGAGARYNRFAASRDPYDSLLSTELTVHEPTVHGRLAVMTTEGADVFADLSGGPTIVLDTIASTQTSAQQRRSVTGAFAAAGGVSLYLPKKWLPRKGASRVSAGLETSFGYQFRGSVDMKTDPELDDDPLRTITADFGDVAMRGFVWRFGLFVRVM